MDIATILDEYSDGIPHDGEGRAESDADTDRDEESDEDDRGDSDSDEVRLPREIVDRLPPDVRRRLGLGVSEPPGPDEEETCANQERQEKQERQEARQEPDQNP